jgi:hypothetical protein
MVSTSFFLLERSARFLYCTCIIAPIQLFVKGFFQDFYLLGEWKAKGARAEKVFFLFSFSLSGTPSLSSP